MQPEGYDKMVCCQNNDLRHFWALTIKSEDYVGVDEIKAVLQRSNKNTPGPDSIRYGDIGTLSDKELGKLAALKVLLLMKIPVLKPFKAHKSLWESGNPHAEYDRQAFGKDDC